MVNKNNQTKDSIAFEKEYAEFVIRVGLKIGYYRRSRNMTQEELAEASNLSQVYISQLEGTNFHYAPSLKTLLRTGKALGVSVYKFLDVEND